ncbi:glycoside hydrolase family 5 protein [Shewanella saliphila]|uniref:Endoglucanase n=1 Tax=Shewanella saliphila TaxID=2282698 RepID=A0ABQ2Q6D3_9GAMM|nr:glycoside hydrolase family 5 protein [Shewanella saliphila]MCL1102244.1 glycoside hydrolase family 5 protein [Shewanella saliphila]GGP54576.1 endoglucanase [Shewanella saliphila]
MSVENAVHQKKFINFNIFHLIASSLMDRISTSFFLVTKLSYHFLCLIFLIILSGCGATDAYSNVPQKAVVLSSNYYSDLYAWNHTGGLKQTRLGRGINVGNYLEAPYEGNWTGGRLLVEEDFKRIAKAGFKNVRIPIRWSAHAEKSSPYTINAAFMNRVKDVVNWANNAGLKAIINVHHYTELIRASERNKAHHISRLNVIWQQINQHFPLSEYSRADVVFELLNEPNGSIHYNDWNHIVENLLTVIWGDMTKQLSDSKQQRIVMVGTADWNIPEMLTKLVLPSYANKNNTIITIHNYKPFHFTHQGAKWVRDSRKWIGTTWLGTENDQVPLIKMFDNIARWNAKPERNFEIFLGEFGVYSRYVDPLQQKAWTAFIAREAEKRNISWAYWEYSSSFGAYDNNTQKWRPQLIEALIPKQ